MGPKPWAHRSWLLAAERHMRLDDFVCRCCRATHGRKTQRRDEASYIVHVRHNKLLNPPLDADT